jgi:hypothetical protein
VVTGALVDPGAALGNAPFARRFTPLGRTAAVASTSEVITRAELAVAFSRVALPVAGDQAPAKATVLRLIDQLGFDSVDADELGESWRQQLGTPVYLTDLDAENVRRALPGGGPAADPPVASPGGLDPPAVDVSGWSRRLRLPARSGSDPWRRWLGFPATVAARVDTCNRRQYRRGGGSGANGGG